MATWRGCTLRIVSVLTVVLIGAATAGFAQDEPESEPRFYLELGGAGALYSLNVEHDLWRAVGMRFGARFPASALPAVAIGGATLRVGKKGSESLYVGVGAAQILGSAEDWELDGSTYGHVTVGLNLQTRSPGGFVRLAFTPLFTAREWHPWFGVAFGWGF